MKYLLSSQQMRYADAYGINELHIPSMILMENAARSAAEIIKQIIAISNPQGSNNASKHRMTILCGSGNNGGDGFAIARHLHQEYSISIGWVGAKQKMSPETRRNHSICTKLGIPIYHIPSKVENFGGMLDEEQMDVLRQKLLATKYANLFDADTIVDALIGIGSANVQQFSSGELVFLAEPQVNLSKAKEHTLKGMVKNLVQQANESDALRIAIDIPTGLFEGGKVGQCAFRAHHTITMAALKTTLLLNDAWEYCGELHIADIGLPERVVARFAQAGILEEDDIRSMIPPRKRNSSKFTYGRVCVIAGSIAMPGAAALCANAAIRSGAGLVELCTTTLHPALLPEIMPTLLPVTEKGQLSPDALPKLMESCAKADVIVIGCGMGSDESTINIIREIINTFLPYKKIVVDADGLRAVNWEPTVKVTTEMVFSLPAPEKSIVRELSEQVRGGVGQRKAVPNLILTPHLGEFKHVMAGRVHGITAEETPYVLDNLATHIAGMMEAIVVLKSFPVIVTQGEYSYWCTEGNPGMATAGSGDVLAGVIGGIACRIANSFDAAAVGVWIHARAGSHALQKSSQESLTASAICDNLQFVFPK